MSAHPKLDEMIAAVDAETALARDLVDILQADQQRVIDQDIEGLEASNREKEQLMLRLQSIERARRMLAEHMAADLGLPPDQARVSALCERLGPESADLERAAQNLRAVLASLQELVAIGRGFLEQSILGIRGLLSLIHSLRTPDPQVYDASGRFETPAAEAVSVTRDV